MKLVLYLDITMIIYPYTKFYTCKDSLRNTTSLELHYRKHRCVPCFTIPSYLGQPTVFLDNTGVATKDYLFFMLHLIFECNWYFLSYSNTQYIPSM